MFWIKKFFRHFVSAVKQLLVAMTGEYLHSGYDGECEYHLYRWRGSYYKLLSRSGLKEKTCYEEDY